MQYDIKSIKHVGDDVLVIEAADENGAEVIGLGWLSAVRNHFDDEHYFADEDGKLHRAPDAPSRTMSHEEMIAYAHERLSEQHPEHEILFEAGDAGGNEASA